MSSPFRKLLVLALLLSGCASAKRQATAPPQAGPKRVLHIVADPNNLPFSNDKLEGFENRVAALVAQRMNATVEYTWRAQRRGDVVHQVGDGMVLPGPDALAQHHLDPRVLGEELVGRAEDAGAPGGGRRVLRVGQDLA